MSEISNFMGWLDAKFAEAERHNYIVAAEMVRRPTPTRKRRKSARSWRDLDARIALCAKAGMGRNDIAAELGVATSRVTRGLARLRGKAWAWKLVKQAA